MTATLALTTLLVREYDEAIVWFTQALGFSVREDTRLSATKRWVVVAPGDLGAALLLARAVREDEIAQVGKQAGGRVAFFLTVSDFDARFALMRAAGVVFLEEPRAEAYGRVVQFQDLYGNRWDLLEQR